MAGAAFLYGRSIPRPRVSAKDFISVLPEGAVEISYDSPFCKHELATQNAAIALISTIDSRIAIMLNLSGISGCDDSRMPAIEGLVQNRLGKAEIAFFEASFDVARKLAELGAFDGVGRRTALERVSRNMDPTLAASALQTLKQKTSSNFDTLLSLSRNPESPGYKKALSDCAAHYRATGQPIDLNNATDLHAAYIVHAIREELGLPGASSANCEPLRLINVSQGIIDKMTVLKFIGPGKNLYLVEKPGS